MTSSNDPFEEALILVADAGEHVTLTDLRLESGLTVISGTTAEPISPASLTAADSGSNRSVTFSKAAITPQSDQATARFMTMGSQSSVGEEHFPGEVNLVEVNADFPPLPNSMFTTSADTFTITDSSVQAPPLIVEAGTITITDSSVQTPGVMFSALNQLRFADSELTATGIVQLTSQQHTEITDSTFEVWEGDIQFEQLPGASASPVGSLTVENSSFRARDPEHDGSEGIIKFELGTLNNYFADNEFKAENHINLSIDADNTTTFTENEFVSGHDDLDSTPGFTVDSGELQYGFLEFHDNEFTYLSDADPYFELNGRLLFTDNVVQGHDNTGTALAVLREDGHTELDLIATGNTFIDFARALRLGGSINNYPGPLFSARINDNVFDFPIEQSGAAAVIDGVRKLHVVDDELDATRNTWGENTDVSVVEMHIQLDNNAEDEVLNIDPLTEP